MGLAVGPRRVYINAGHYAQQLMMNCCMNVQHRPNGSIQPSSILQNAFSNTKALGSSTACLVALTSENCLHFENIGDSGFVVIRGNSIIHRSPIMSLMIDLVYYKQESKVKVNMGDIIVAGTDGLFDNLFEQDIIKRVLTTSMGRSPCYLARLLAKDAKSCSQDKNYRSPFSLRAEMSGYMHCGVKHDDITVLVAYVVPSSRL